MKICTVRNKIHSIFLIYSLFAFAPTQAASIFEWTWTSGDVYIEGEFHSDIDFGTISEADVTYSYYTVYQGANNILYEIDLINELLFINDLQIDVTRNDHFEYTIGSNSFNAISPDNKASYPIELDIYTDEEFYGLSFYDPDQQWDLSYGTNFEYAFTPGFDSGPIISSVPLPPSLWLFFTGLISLFYLNINTKKT